MKNKIVKHLADEMQNSLQSALSELSQAKHILPTHPEDTKHPAWNVAVAYEKLKSLEKILELLR